jgi:hypothetical protein
MWILWSRFLAWEAPAHRDARRGDFDRSMGKCLARSVGVGTRVAVRQTRLLDLRGSS